MKNSIEIYSKKYWLIMLIFLGVFTVGQSITAYYWDKSLKLIDIFELVLSPACCFSIASLIGYYRNKLFLLVTTFYVFLLGNVFYAFFQKISFFKESDIMSLIITNIKIFGIPLAIQTIIAVLICYLVIKKSINN